MKIMKWRYLFFVLAFIFGVPKEVSAQEVALKTNVAYWMVTAPNLGFEVALNAKWSLDLSGVYKPWIFNGDKNIRFWLAQPELRYWFCESFEGHFVGVHLHGAQYYATNKDRIYDGYLAGGGFVYGYNWILSPRWNMEVLVGLGYARLWYKEMPNLPCMKCREDKVRDYVGPTKIALSFSYMF